MINLQDIKDFVEAELSQSEDNQPDILLHREKGKAIFGNDLNEAIDFIHESIKEIAKQNGYVSSYETVYRKSVDILATMFYEETLDKLKK